MAEALGYESPRSAISKKVDAEDRSVAKMETPSGVQEMTIINESGLYSLILSSKLESTRKFKHWVTAEVLPQIRKHGEDSQNKILFNFLILMLYLIKFMCLGDFFEKMFGKLEKKL